MKYKIKLIFISFLLLVISANGLCQDIYDSANSHRYADYLFKSKEYTRAVLEYERTCFLDSQNWDAHFYLMQSYRKSGQETKGLKHFQSIRFRLPQNQLLPFEHENHVCRFIAQPSWFITKTEKDSVSELPYFKSPALLLSHDWNAAKTYLSGINYKNDKTLTKYYDNSVEGLKLNYKKPWLAGTMSAIVPGLGKVYTGYYKDGIMAFLMTGVSAYQAYRGFKAKGAGSGIFIIYTGLTAGFYLGNIYGAVKSARQKNRRINDRIDKKTYEVFYQWAE